MSIMTVFYKQVRAWIWEMMSARLTDFKGTYVRYWAQKEIEAQPVFRKRSKKARSKAGKAAEFFKAGEKERLKLERFIAKKEKTLRA